MGPLDHTLKPRSGNGGACSSLTGPKFVEQAASVPPSGAYKKRYGGSAHSSAHALELVPSPLLPSATASLSLFLSLSSNHAIVRTPCRVIEPTAFRKFYERGDLPIAIHHAGLGNKLKWKVGCVQLRLAASRRSL